jgi:hypothetical protein
MDIFVLHGRSKDRRTDYDTIFCTYLNHKEAMDGLHEQTFINPQYDIKITKSYISSTTRSLKEENNVIISEAGCGSIHLALKKNID